MEEIIEPWSKANMGELSSLEIWAAAGFQGDLEKVERNYLDTIFIVNTKNPRDYEEADIRIWRG